MFEILARKNAQRQKHSGGFNSPQGKSMKSQVSGNGPKVVRKQGRGS